MEENLKLLSALAEIRNEIASLPEQGSDIDLVLAGSHNEALNSIWEILAELEDEIKEYNKNYPSCNVG